MYFSDKEDEKTLNLLLSNNNAAAGDRRCNKICEK